MLTRTVLPLLVVAATAAVASACPFCPVTAPTLAEQQAERDAVVLAQWAGGDPEGGDLASYSEFEVVEVLKAPAGGLKKGDRFRTIPFYEAAKGDLFLLMAKQESEALTWDAPQPVTETSWQYIAQAPSLESPPEKRLAYFARFLEYPDELISADAFAEFSRAKYDDVAPLAKTFSRDRVRRWLASDDPKIAPRGGFYGMVLGLCGTAEDASFLEHRILDTSKSYRQGIDGLIGGYLLLSGEKGLDVVERALVADPSAADGDANDVMSALRFMWTYGGGRIGPERLKRSMRLMLDRDAVLELAITDLARWKDWSVQARLAELFGREWDDPAAQRGVRGAVVQYMLAAVQDAPADPGAKTPEHVGTARKHLEAFREKDPVAVKAAERSAF